MTLPRRAACAVLLAAIGTTAAAGCGTPGAANETVPPVPQSAAASAGQASEAPVASIPFTPPPPAYLGTLAPFPTSPYAPPRPPELIKAVYTFAARHPEVLHYVPCFCGCQRSGHSDNDDCFIQGREPNGRPIWDAHGMT